MTVSEIIDRALQDQTFGQGFSFRPGQRDCIETICNKYLENSESTVILDAPTGTGKSIIAMWVSWVLKELGNSGYMITSDLTLQDQYQRDFVRLNLNWPSIKGVDNYDCHVNGLKFSLGECRMRNMGYERSMSLPCASNCSYLQIRKRAIDHPICLLNYSFWLVHRNYVAPKHENEGKKIPFDKRDFAIFDEAHRVDEIVQSHFSPRIEKNLVNVINNQVDFLRRKGLPFPQITKSAVHDLVMDMFKPMSPVATFRHLKNLEQLLLKFAYSRREANQRVDQQYSKNTQLPSDWKSGFGRFDIIKDVHCKIEDYTALINRVGLDKMVCDITNEEVKFTCVEEAAMIRKHLHDQSGFKVFMSATIGNPRTYAKLIGIEEATVIRLDNGFNYQKSPIVVINGPRMSKGNREHALPRAVEMLDRILDRHKNQRGVIHTGSYEITDYIMTHTEHAYRLKNYEGTAEKKLALESHIDSGNSVLIGPSVLEGLDLYDDLSRFQVFFKVPFPYLGDPLIKAKLKHSPDWYDWKTSISLMQGVGRSVRGPEDWAITYVIDGSFKRLINKPGFFPDSFKQRIKILK